MSVKSIHNCTNLNFYKIATEVKLPMAGSEFGFLEI